MDGTQFDQWTQRIGASPSRRGILRTLAGGALAGTLGLIGAREAAASRGGKGDSCKKDNDCQKGLKCDIKNNEDKGKCEYKNNCGGKKGDFCKKNKECCSGLECQGHKCKDKNN